MAVVVPLIGAFMSVSAGIAAGAATLGGFLSIAGGVLLGVGAITGKEDLLKIGGILSLGGAAATAVGGSSAAAGGEASAAFDGAGSAAGSDAAQFGKYGWQDPTLTSASQGSTVGTIGAEAMKAATTDPSTGILGYAQRLGGTGGGTTQAATTSALSATANQPAAGVVSQYVDPVQAAGATMDAPTMNSILQSAWDKTKALGTGVGDFVRNNKELVQLGGGILQGMYGPQAEQMDFERQAYERRMRNLNSPVALGRLKPLATGV